MQHKLDISNKFLLTLRGDIIITGFMVVYGPTVDHDGWSLGNYMIAPSLPQIVFVV